ncbi:MAG: HlyD family type I secretion periplasmic adaptor subunit [Aurantimonas coralicida]|uniref:HlyD family type I secretion periplasmic adaptor subunit n=2 Tax=Aurantimonas coralicida TaxID=182270 RepID=UPI001D19233E|nr:HlyD family type I secretion periplasmic adaptor subunit [Aurantimonas coralicida]MCC4299163.1 HlyD family type I secretion periplasmic adaptor subunit [Aurantimonas coralicida]MCW7545947.1 HlyD family type I secretion periplasmic adaptor subunit [Aurantimonas litoralis]|tara:strand:- start:67 stop:1398 length:1332 start_codon:yes stop_codon:yes gene_type:complete
MTKKPVIEEWYQDVPRSIRGAVLGGTAIALVIFGGFGSWAGTAPLSAAIVAPGSFMVTGRNKQVQHLEGGIIDRILVAEGEHVTKGQTLVLLDETRPRMDVRRLSLRLALLQAKSARLQAMMRGDKEVNFSGIRVEAEDSSEKERIIAAQNSVFHADLAGLEGSVAIVERNRDSLDARLRGAQAQKKSAERQKVLIAEEYVGKKKLLDQGLYRRSDLFTIERAAAEVEGLMGKIESDIGDFQSQIERLNGQIEQVHKEFRQKAADEVQTVFADIDDIHEQLMNARSVLGRVDVRSPVSGILVKMNYHTSGGVIEAGSTIAEILPDGEKLLIETVIDPHDVDDVRVGQHASVRLMSFNQRTTPQLRGELVYVSADTVSDPRAGRNENVYIARIALGPAQRQRVAQLKITPGMPADVFIETSSRTFLEYLIKPINDSMSRAFREK